MCILPQSKSGTCVTDKLLYGLWRLPCFEQVGDYGMPQVMVGNFQSRNAHRCIDGRYCLGQTYRKETSRTHGKGKKAVLKICSLRLYKASTYKLDYENDIFFCRMMQQSLHKNDPGISRREVLGAARVAWQQQTMEITLLYQPSVSYIATGVLWLAFTPVLFRLRGLSYAAASRKLPAATLLCFTEKSPRAHSDAPSFKQRPRSHRRFACKRVHRGVD